MAVEAWAVAFAAGAFFVVAPVTPFRMVLMTVLFVAGADVVDLVAAAARPVGFLTTVDVLPSLDSLMPLTLLAVRVVAVRVVVDGAAAAPLLARVAAVVLPAAELAVDDVVVFRVVAAARVDRAFSTMLLIMFVALFCLVGDTGRAIIDLAGEGGARSRGSTRVLED